MAEPEILDLVTEVCAAAVHNGYGIVIAVPDGYATSPAPASDLFLAVDAEAAHNPASTFFDADLDLLLEKAPLPTIGVFNETSDDAESLALKAGYARDRVRAYQRLKQDKFNEKTERETGAVKRNLTALEERILDGGAFESETEKNATAISISRDEMTGLCNSDIASNELTPDLGSKLGTERFVALVFASPSHEAMSAANASGGGIRVSESRLAYPAYVTVHNSKGAICALPATATEPRPNSVIVPCAASLVCRLHALACSNRADRNYELVAHHV